MQRSGRLFDISGRPHLHPSHYKLQGVWIHKTQKRLWETLELEFQELVLGNQFRSSARAARALHGWTISTGPAEIVSWTSSNNCSFLLRQGPSVKPWLAWKWLCRQEWPRTQRSACSWLYIPGIKAMHQQSGLIVIFFSHWYVTKLGQVVLSQDSLHCGLETTLSPPHLLHPRAEGSLVYWLYAMWMNLILK